MADGVTVEGLDGLKKLADAYRDAEPAIQKRVRTSLQASAKDLAAEVIHKGSEQMPARGGLRGRLAASRGGVTVALKGRNVSVSIRAKTREGYALRQIDRGVVRHPLFGNKGFWFDQRVPEHAFTGVFEKGAPKVREDTSKAVQAALDDIAREGT